MAKTPAAVCRTDAHNRSSCGACEPGAEVVLAWGLHSTGNRERGAVHSPPPVSVTLSALNSHCGVVTSPVTTSFSLSLLLPLAV